MEYKPSLPEENYNVSHAKPFREFLEIAFSLLLIGVVVFLLLGWMVDLIVERMSPATEASIHSMMSSKLITTPRELAARQADVQQLVDRLQQCAGGRSAPVQVIMNPKANAAVLPGGGMLVFSGLLDDMKSENGLSFVLAHELAHLQHRDHLRGMGRALVLVATFAVLTGGSGDVSDLMAPATQLGVAQYSRARESMADAAALKMLHCRYGHVGGATELFDKLKQGDDAWAVSHYLRSHPLTGPRIDELNKTMVQRGWARHPVLPLKLAPVAAR